MLDVELEALEQGSATGSTGTSYADHQEKKKDKGQVKRAKKLGPDMFLAIDQGSGFKIGPKSKHQHCKTASR